jgi:hypothetical protein
LRKFEFINVPFGEPRAARAFIGTVIADLLSGEAARPTGQSASRPQKIGTCKPFAKLVPDTLARHLLVNCERHKAAGSSLCCPEADG